MWTVIRPALTDDRHALTSVATADRPWAEADAVVSVPLPFSFAPPAFRLLGRGVF